MTGQSSTLPPPSIENTVAVSVTYGNRYDHVERLVPAIQRCGIQRLFLVDNATPEETAQKLDALASESEIAMHVVRNAENEGSAGGFAVGLSSALKQSNAQWFWLLDDDNVPDESSFSMLRNAHTGRSLSQMDALLSLRVDRVEYVTALKNGHHEGIRPNSFMGFSTMQYIKSKIGRPESGCLPNESGLVELGYAPYGGLLISKAALEGIGLPNTRLFLYGDDHEFTIRIRAQGGHIYLVGASRISDGEASWDSSERADARVAPTFSKQSPDLYVYYLVRNRVFVELGVLTSKTLYIVNTLLSIAISATKAAFLQRDPLFVMRRLRLVFSAIHAAWRGRLGKAPA